MAYMWWPDIDVIESHPMTTSSSSPNISIPGAMRQRARPRTAAFARKGMQARQLISRTRPRSAASNRTNNDSEQCRTHQLDSKLVLVNRRPQTTARPDGNSFSFSCAGDSFSRLQSEAAAQRTLDRYNVFQRPPWYPVRHPPAKFAPELLTRKQIRAKREARLRRQRQRAQNRLGDTQRYVEMLNSPEGQNLLMIQAATTGAPFPFVVVRAVKRFQRCVRRQQQVMQNCATNLVNAVRTRNARLMLQQFRKRATLARTRWAALKEHLGNLAEANRKRNLRPKSTKSGTIAGDTCVGVHALADGSGEHHAAVMVGLAPTERSCRRAPLPRSLPAPDMATAAVETSEYTGASWRRPLFSGDFHFCGQLARFHIEVQAPTAPVAPGVRTRSKNRPTSPFVPRAYSPPNERRRRASVEAEAAKAAANAAAQGEHHPGLSFCIMFYSTRIQLEVSLRPLDWFFLGYHELDHVGQEKAVRLCEQLCHCMHDMDFQPGAVMQVPMFANLSGEPVQAICDSVRMQSYYTNDEICHQGDIGDDGMYFVHKGILAVEIDGITISQLGPGDHFGEVALVTASCKRTATVVAESHCTLYRLSRAAVKDISTRFPEFRRSMQDYAKTRGYVFINHSKRNSTPNCSKAIEKHVGFATLDEIMVLDRGSPHRSSQTELRGDSALTITDKYHEKSPHPGGICTGDTSMENGSAPPQQNNFKNKLITAKRCTSPTRRRTGNALVGDAISSMWSSMESPSSKGLSGYTHAIKDVVASGRSSPATAVACEEASGRQSTASDSLQGLKVEESKVPGMHCLVLPGGAYLLEHTPEELERLNRLRRDQCERDRRAKFREHVQTQKVKDTLKQFQLTEAARQATIEAMRERVFSSSTGAKVQSPGQRNAERLNMRASHGVHGRKGLLRPKPRLAKGLDTNTRKSLALA